jgi:hypothetical protein
MVDDPTSEPGRKLNIQDFLQERFMKMYEKLVEAVGDVDGVIGFEVRACESDFSGVMPS